jgi:hypothetical protein
MAILKGPRVPSLNTEGLPLWWSRLSAHSKVASSRNPLLVCYGIDRFKHSELRNRRVACLGEGILFVGDGGVYRDCIPVQNGIRSGGCGPEQTRERATKEC